MFALLEFGFGLLLLLLALVCIPLAVATFAFWICMLIDSIRNNRNSPTGRVLWTAVVWFVPVIGSILYFIFGRNRHLRPGVTPASA